MPRRRAHLLSAAVALATACDGPSGGEPCVAVTCILPGVWVDVVDAGTGRPVAGSSVQVSASVCVPDRCPCFAHPQEGRFFCILPAEGDYSLSAHALGYGSASTTVTAKLLSYPGACSPCLGAPEVSIALPR